MVGRCMFDFTGETAVVTGSTKGIGHGIASGLARSNANVVINARTPEDVHDAVEQLADEGTGDIHGVAADVGEPEEMENLIGEAINEFSEIDLLVNNAAVWPREESIIEAELSDWEYTMNVNLRAPFYLSKLVGAHMVENRIGGNIINVTSQTADRRAGDRGIYGISNTGLNGLTWRLAYQLAEHGIRVNGISTDATLTYQLRQGAAERAAQRDDMTAEEVLEEMGENRPIGRLGDPKDLADAVRFLASDRAEYIVGEILRVSGGGNLQ